MALFKILRGSSENFTTDLTQSNVSPAFHDGHCYFIVDTGLFYVDYENNGNKYRIPLNAGDAKTILGATLEHDVLRDSEVEIPSSALLYAVKNTIEGSVSSLEARKANKITGLPNQLVGFDDEGNFIAKDSAKPDWNQNDESNPAFIENRTHWEDSTTVIAEQTIITDPYTLTLIDTNAQFVDGKSYEVVFNDKTFVLTAHQIIQGSSIGPSPTLLVNEDDSSNSIQPLNEDVIRNPIILGNESIINPTLFNDTGHDFIFSYYNGDVALMTKDTGSISHTFSINEPVIHYLDRKYIKDMYGEIYLGETVFFEEQAATFDNTPFINFPIDVNSNLKVDNTYIVNYDGVSYKCVAWADPYVSGFTCIGNGAVVGYDVFNGYEPFVIHVSNYGYDDYEYKDLFLSVATPGTHTFSIVAMETEIIKVPNKFLPNYNIVNGENPTALKTVGASYASGDFSFAEGSGTITIGECSHAEGENTTACGNFTHAEGYDTIAAGDRSHVEGYGRSSFVRIFPLNDEDKPYKYGFDSSYSSRMKDGAIIVFENFDAEIRNVDYNSCTFETYYETIPEEAFEDNVRVRVYTSGISSGQSSHAEGDETIASGNYSHAEGSNTVAYGSYSHAEGDRTIASGDRSHAEGSNTVAYGKYSHAEGSNTIAYGSSSHAEGCGETTSIYPTGDAGATTYTLNRQDSYLKVGSVIKYNNKLAIITSYDPDTLTITVNNTLDSSNALNATYMVAHCSGLATGAWSHSEGEDTIASGSCSHAEGEKTHATESGLHVLGSYNYLDENGSAGDYAHVVGNGTSRTRSNAHTIDWSGNAWFAGDVYVGSTSGTNRDEGSVKLATMDDLLNSARDAILLNDKENGYSYYVEMRNGHLTCRCKAISLEITTMPTITTYTDGSAFNPSGMVITATAQDGSRYEVTEYTYDKNVMNNKSYITVYFDGASVNIPITINTFNPEILLIDFDYTSNDDGTYTITGWKETLNGEPSTEMIIPDNALIRLL